MDNPATFHLFSTVGLRSYLGCAQYHRQPYHRARIISFLHSATPQRTLRPVVHNFPQAHPPKGDGTLCITPCLSLRRAFLLSLSTRLARFPAKGVLYADKPAPLQARVFQRRGRVPLFGRTIAPCLYHAGVLSSAARRDSRLRARPLGLRNPACAHTRDTVHLQNCRVPVSCGR